MPQWCIAYGCTNSSDMKIKKSWHRLPLENKELLSKWLTKIRRTNTSVNEHSRLCGDHFEADCFKKIPGSSRVNLKPGSIPTKFCFVQEKAPRKPPAERKSVERKQPLSYVNNPSDDMTECEIDNMELEIEESKEERLRRRIKELELSLERETAQRKTAEAALETKRFSVKNWRQDPKVFKFYTGFTEEQFCCLLEFLGDRMNNLTYWGSSSASNSNNEDLGGSKPGPSRKLTAEDELLLVLTRLHVGMLEQDLAVRFVLSQWHVSRIITTWVNAMFQRFKEVDIWPMREQSLANLPEKVRVLSHIKVHH